MQVKITESRAELLKKLQAPRKYLDVCPFCGKYAGEHSHEEMVVCVIKKFVAQGTYPEYFEGEVGI